MRSFLCAVALLVMSKSANAQDIKLIQSPVAVMVTTAAFTGVGQFSIKVPGTFTGFSNPFNMRYLSYIEILSDNIAMGDFVDDIQVSDDDGVVPVPARTRFPSYPTIINFSADTGVGTKAGYYLSQSGQTRISTFPQLGLSGREEPQALPSGLYLKAKINNAGLLSRTYRINIVWGRAISGF